VRAGRVDRDFVLSAMLDSSNPVVRLYAKLAERLPE
jgi:hypothetical protein